VSLSSGGNTALISGQNDDFQNGGPRAVGAAWLYAGSGASWTEQQKIVPTDETGGAYFGGAVTLSGDGSTAVVGGADDNSSVGAAWIYAGAQPPVVTKVTPSSGPRAGRTRLTITGANFTGESAVDVGSAAATSVTLVNSGEITATSPAGTGTVDVTVTTPVGTSAKSAADEFTYLPAPICRLAPKSSTLTVPLRHGRPAAAAGTVALIATCDQAATGSLTGSVSETIKPRHGRARTKVVRLPSAHVTVSASVQLTVKLTVSKALVVALEGGAKESATFRLSATNANGTAGVGASIAKLKP
jgi:hypothetical protein